MSININTNTSQSNLKTIIRQIPYRLFVQINWDLEPIFIFYSAQENRELCVPICILNSIPFFAKVISIVNHSNFDNIKLYDKLNFVTSKNRIDLDKLKVKYNILEIIINHAIYEKFDRNLCKISASDFFILKLILHFCEVKINKFELYSIFIQNYFSHDSKNLFIKINDDSLRKKSIKYIINSNKKINTEFFLEEIINECIDDIIYNDAYLSTNTYPFSIERFIQKLLIEYSCSYLFSLTDFSKLSSLAQLFVFINEPDINLMQIVKNIVIENKCLDQHRQLYSFECIFKKLLRFNSIYNLYGLVDARRVLDIVDYSHDAIPKMMFSNDGIFFYTKKDVDKEFT